MASVSDSPAEPSEEAIARLRAAAAYTQARGPAELRQDAEIYSRGSADIDVG